MSGAKQYLHMLLQETLEHDAILDKWNSLSLRAKTRITELLDTIPHPLKSKGLEILLGTHHTFHDAEITSLRQWAFDKGMIHPDATAIGALKQLALSLNTTKPTRTQPYYIPKQSHVFSMNYYFPNYYIVEGLQLLGIMLAAVGLLFWLCH